MKGDENVSLSACAELVNRYAEHAAQHGEATEKGIADVANAAYNELHRVLALIDHADQRDALRSLLTHSNPAVRAKAAFHTHRIDPVESESVLDEVSHCQGLVGFSAGVTLERIRDGKLKPP